MCLLFAVFVICCVCFLLCLLFALFAVFAVFAVFSIRSVLAGVDVYLCSGTHSAVLVSSTDQSTVCLACDMRVAVGWFGLCLVVYWLVLNQVEKQSSKQFFMLLKRTKQETNGFHVCVHTPL